TVAGVTLLYDANGNLLSDGTQRYSYDHANRLVGVADTGGASLLTVSYDPLGRIREITDASGTARRSYVGVETVEETRGTSVRSYCSTFGVDQALTFAEGGAVRHLHRDQTWSVLAVSDATGG